MKKNTQLVQVKEIHIPQPAEAAEMLYGENSNKAVEEAIQMLYKVSKIDTEASKIEADGYVKHAKRIIKDLGEVREGYTKPLVALQKALIAGEKHFIHTLTEEVAGIEQKINAFLREQLKKKQEEERRIAEAKEAELKRKRSPETIAAIENKYQAQEQTIAQPTGAKTVWKFEVVDASKVPAGFLMVNESAIKNAVANGVRQIDGVRIFEDISRSGR